MVTEQIQPIINGSVNPRLTPELFKDLDKTTKRQVIWNILVSLEFAHCFPEVDPKIFKPSDFKKSYEDVFNDDEADLDNLFVTTKEQYNAHHNRMLTKTANHHFELGKRIYEAQRELGFGGFLTLDKNRMQGYINACGSWNDFNSSNISYALGMLDKLAPRMNYGANNPNTGSRIHEWKSVHGCEYLVMEYEYIDEKTLERVKEFYKTHWEPKGKSIKADSIRMEISEHGQNYFGIELIWWWD
jgi:hypothetical protein